jgi:hypothetical protein
MNEVAELARKLAEEAAQSGKAKTALVLIQDYDGVIHKTEFGFGDNVSEATSDFVGVVSKQNKVVITMVQNSDNELNKIESGFNQNSVEQTFVDAEVAASPEPEPEVVTAEPVEVEPVAVEPNVVEAEVVQPPEEPTKLNAVDVRTQ